MGKKVPDGFRTPAVQLVASHFNDVRSDCSRSEDMKVIQAKVTVSFVLMLHEHGFNLRLLNKADTKYYVLIE